MKKSITLILLLSLTMMVVLSGCGAAQSASAEPEASSADSYIFYVTDAYGNGIENVRLQVCSDELCSTFTTDSDGVVIFDGEPAKYEVHVLKCPDGYTYDFDDVYETAEMPEQVNFVLTETGEEASDDSTAASAASAVTGITLKFTTTDLEGNTVTSEELFGQYDMTLVNLWESWCPPCRGELGDLEKLYEDYQDKGIGIVGVMNLSQNNDWGRPSNIDDVYDLIQENGTSYPLIAYTEDFVAFDTDSRPTSFFVDKNGNIICPEGASFIEEMKENYIDYYGAVVEDFKEGAFDDWKTSADEEERDSYEYYERLASMTEAELMEEIEDIVSEETGGASDFGQIVGPNVYEGWVAIINEHYYAAFGKELD